jgi:hypothetical protein
VEQTQLLRSVRRVHGGIKVDGHLSTRAAEAKSMPIYDSGDQRLAHPIRIASSSINSRRASADTWKLSYLCLS